MQDIIDFDKEYLKDYKIICGIDEAGRGPIAGPVVSATVIVDYNLCVNSPEINDSKKLTPQKRKVAYDYIIKNFKVATSIISHEIIDNINILNASLLSFKESYNKLNIPAFALIDGNKKPKDFDFSTTIIKGDSKSYSIACASIVAKCLRDKIMHDLHQEYPEYNWQKNAGYPTKEHISALNKYGISPYHRKTFKPVKILL